MYMSNSCWHWLCFVYFSFVWTFTFSVKFFFSLFPFNKGWQWLYHTCLTTVVSGVKRYRLNKTASDWFDSFLVVRKSNSQQNRWAIEFHWIFVRFCSSGKFRRTQKSCENTCLLACDPRRILFSQTSTRVSTTWRKYGTCFLFLNWNPKFKGMWCELRRTF